MTHPSGTRGCSEASCHQHAKGGTSYHRMEEAEGLPVPPGFVERSFFDACVVSS